MSTSAFDNRPDPSRRGDRRSWWGMDHSSAAISPRDRTRRYSLRLGAAAGLVFSLSLWAYEAVLFIGAHVAYPWLPVLVGTFLCVLVGAGAALLTHWVNRALLGVFFWIVAAGLIAVIAITLPLKIVPALMKVLEPALQFRLPVYPINASFRTWAVFGTIWLAIFFGILGLLQITLVEGATPASTNAGRLVPYFIFLPVVILASVMSSNLINSQLRAPLLGTDKLIRFAIENEGTTVDPALARQMHLSSLNTVADLIDRPRRLFLGTYDVSYWQVEVLVDFDGEWVTCTTVGGEPVFCKSLTD